MNYNKLEHYVSQPRLNRYLTAVGNSNEKALKLYHANLIVAQSFYPILSLFEVIFRNICNYWISDQFANPDWIIDEKDRFMNDQSLSRLNFHLRKSVSDAERRIRKKGGRVTAGKVFAEQSFGFWTSFFEPQHYRLIGGVVILCFPNKPVSVNRSVLSQKLERIRGFRNRIYHNEPICFDGNNIDFTYAIKIKTEIFELLDWIDNDLSEYVKAFDTIDSKINSANRI